MMMRSGYLNDGIHEVISSKREIKRTKENQFFFVSLCCVVSISTEDRQNINGVKQKKKQNK